MDDMQAWTKVVTDPLGLAGFALFLVFGIIARVGFSKKQRWLAVSAFAMAFVALVGGLALSWVKTASTPVTPSSATTSTQTTHGAQSPAVQGVQGDVTITIDGGKTKEK